MKECLYYIKGQREGKPFIKLMEFVDEQFSKVLDTKTIQDISDVVYSKAPLKDSIITKIGEIKHDYIITAARTVSTYDDELGGDGSTLSNQEFLEDPSCVIDGERLVRPYNVEELRRREFQELTKEKGLSKDEANKMLDEEDANRAKFKDDAVTLHKLIDGYNVYSTKVKSSDYYDAVQDVIKGTPFEGREALIKNLKSLMEHFVSEYIYRTLVNARIISNVGLKAKIEALGKDIIGHIDYISVDDSGTLHIYNFKASLRTVNYWTADKWKKYNYSMAFLKQMLAYNGIPIKNISMNIVPVQMTYEGDLKTVTIGNPLDITVSRSGTYLLDLYDKHARHFIPSHVEIPHVGIETFMLTDDLFHHIFPVINMRNEGTYRSAVDMIKNAPEAGEAEPLVIREVNDDKGRWEVIIGGKSYRPKSNKPKNSNLEILDIVVEHLNEIQDETLQTVHTLKEAIRKMNQVGEHGVFVPESDIIDKLKGISNSRNFIKTMLDVYFNDISEWQRDGERKIPVYKWKLLDDLLDYNIILMKNKETNQLDIISLSAFNCDTEIPFGKGRHNLLGAYKNDVQTNTLHGTYGNAEIIRAVVLLNLIIPTLDMENIKLGKVKVLSHTGTSYSYPISTITLNYLPEIISTVSKESGIEFKNNFNNLKLELFVDPLETVLDEYAALALLKGEGLMMLYSPDKYEALGKLIESDESYKKTVILKELLESMWKWLPDRNPSRIANIAKGREGSQLDLKLCRLYKALSDAYHHYTGEKLNYEMELSDIHAKMSTTNHIPNQNIRIVTDNLAQTYNSIAREIELYYIKNIRGFILEFMKAKGYNVVLNATLGNELSLFKKMFEPDKENLRFKNPWTDGSLDEDEAKFLKKALYQFYLIRNHNQDPLGFGSYDSPEIPKFIASRAGGYKYLWVPLMRASSSTRVMLNLDVQTWRGRAKRVLNIIKDPQQFYYDLVEKLTERERELKQQGLHATDERLGHVFNVFLIGDETDRAGTRLPYIKEQGIDFFETNIENLLLLYLTSLIETTKLNDFMIGTRSLLFQLTMMGEDSGRSDIMKREIEYIRNFLKVNVFNGTIKSETGRVITGMLSGLRSQVTLINLGGNAISFFRDIFQGFEENFMRTVTKLNTDIEAKTLSLAYAYVVKNSLTNTFNVNMLSKLQERFRLSNIDLASMESLKIGRGGITNYKNWAYSTLRRPDFLNRMTLFVARCMQDGCWEGWTIDENDNLVYDWKKDKRFKALIDGTAKNSTEYKLTKALYMSKVREWNDEHPEEQVDLNPETAESFLPLPYSDKEILSIKEVADNIYGAYDKSLKSMGEHTTLMWFFGMYTTWMNGIWNNYFMKPGLYSANMSKRELVTSKAGKPLFLDEDGRITEVDTGMPLTKNIPTIMLGVFYTLLNLYYVFGDGGVKALKDYITANPNVRASLAKLISDMLVTLFMFCAFKFALDPAYKDYKKDMKDTPVLANLATEIFYKAGSRSYDSFRGPLNFKDWLGDNTASPMYEVNLKVGQDALRMLSGNKTPLDVFVGNFAALRSGKDTYNAWKKAQE